MASQKLTLRVGGADRTIVVREIIKVSLGTKDVGEAKTRHAAVQAQLQERWATAKKAAVTLTHEEILGLAGRAYRELIAEFRADPGDPEGWGVYADQLAEPFEHLDEDSVASPAPPMTPSSGLAF